MNTTIDDTALCTQADLARRWGISRARVNQLSKREEFPAPITHTAGGQALYDPATCDQWNTERLDSWRYRT